MQPPPACPAHRYPFAIGDFCAGQSGLRHDVRQGRNPFRVKRESGAARCADGLGMLIEQAAAAFELWRGVRPEHSPFWPT